MYVSMYVCMYVSIYLCMHARFAIKKREGVQGRAQRLPRGKQGGRSVVERVSSCIYVSSPDLAACPRMYACMYVCVYVCVCMSVGHMHA